MQWPSFTFILTKLFLIYIVYSIYNLYLLFKAPVCKEGKQCLTSYLNQEQQLQLQIYSSIHKYPTEQLLDFVYATNNFNYTHASSQWVYTSNKLRFLISAFLGNLAQRKLFFYITHVM